MTKVLIVKWGEKFQGVRTDDPGLHVAVFDAEGKDDKLKTAAYAPYPVLVPLSEYHVRGSRVTEGDVIRGEDLGDRRQGLWLVIYAKDEVDRDTRDGDYYYRRVVAKALDHDGSYTPGGAEFVFFQPNAKGLCHATPQIDFVNIVSRMEKTWIPVSEKP